MTLFTITFLLLGLHQVIAVPLNPAQMIATHGYPSETHSVTTEDGYILALYRIPHGINDNVTTHKPPVLLMHGINSFAGEFTALGPELGLSYILADAGYDVWLGNARGTTPSRNHTSINVDTNPEQFFNFTWHEIGYYDVASYVDYILQKNGDDGLYYVGHSQGSTAFLVLTSMRPEYNSKFKLASLMAPVAIIKHYKNIIIQFFAKGADLIWRMLQKIHIYEVPASLIDLINLLSLFCKEFDSAPVNLICKYNVPNLEKYLIPIVSANCLSSSGLKQYIHYAQLIRDGGFHLWSYENNLVVYGSETAPEYPLSQISTPIAFYYSTKDEIVTTQDEFELVSRIPNVAINYQIPDDSFYHKDFALHSRVVELVYNKLLSVMLEFK